jgi:hypothetical protein
MMRGDSAYKGEYFRRRFNNKELPALSAQGQIPELISRGPGTFRHPAQRDPPIQTPQFSPNKGRARTRCIRAE